MGCCASSPATHEGAKDTAHARSKPPDKELQVLKIRKEDTRRREQHWKVTGIVGLRSNNLKVSKSDCNFHSIAELLIVSC